MHWIGKRSNKWSLESQTVRCYITDHDVENLGVIMGDMKARNVTRQLLDDTRSFIVSLPLDTHQGEEWRTSGLDSAGNATEVEDEIETESVPGRTGQQPCRKRTEVEREADSNNFQFLKERDARLRHEVPADTAHAVRADWSGSH